MSNKIIIKHGNGLPTTEQVAEGELFYDQENHALGIHDEHRQAIYCFKSCFMPNLESYPIGTILFSYDETSPAERVGGTWSRLSCAGKFLVGQDGSKYVLGESNEKFPNFSHTHSIPSHTHKTTNHTHSISSHNHSMTSLQPCLAIETSGSYQGVNILQRHNTGYTYNFNYYYEPQGGQVTGSSGSHTISPVVVGNTTSNSSKTDSTGAVTSGSNTGTTGLTQPYSGINNLPKYSPVYMWERIS